MKAAGAPVLPRSISVPGDTELNGGACVGPGPLALRRCSSQTPHATASSCIGNATVVSPGAPPREPRLVAEADDREPAWNRPSVPALSPAGLVDRKSTRLNSSHVRISYAVFCLKKKKT